MLMAWGPFRFTVPNYSVESLSQSVQPRAEAQPIIDAIPTMHRLGPGNEQVTLQSTFHPHHLNGRGLAQLAGVKQAVNALRPMMLTHVNGAAPNVFGLWLGTGFSNEQTMFDRAGVPCMVTTTLTLTQYGGSAAAARVMAVSALSASVNFSASIDFGGIGVNANVQIGF